uniref:Uncharacterized protein n=1 Tax=Arundo donax TaxID=35708 RepID=A0A0A8YPQ4_ARUDO
MPHSHIASSFLCLILHARNRPRTTMRIRMRSLYGLRMPAGIGSFRVSGLHGLVVNSAGCPSAPPRPPPPPPPLSTSFSLGQMALPYPYVPLVSNSHRL